MTTINRQLDGGDWHLRSTTPLGQPVSKRPLVPNLGGSGGKQGLSLDNQGRRRPATRPSLPVILPRLLLASSKPPSTRQLSGVNWDLCSSESTDSLGLENSPIQPQPQRWKEGVRPYRQRGQQPDVWPRSPLEFSRSARNPQLNAARAKRIGCAFEVAT